MVQINHYQLKKNSLANLQEVNKELRAKGNQKEKLWS